MAFISNPRGIKNGDGKKPFTPEELALRESFMKTGENIVAQGCVLLKNENVLPLATDKVNVFGALSADPFFGGRGSATSDNSFAIGFYTAMEEQGISYNKTLYNLYKNWALNKKASTAPYPQEQTTKKQQKQTITSTIISVFSKPYVKELLEKYLTDEVMREAKAFSDTAVVFIGRSGSEQHDMKSEDLSISQPERQMLDKVCRHFENVVVILNTAGVLECGFLEEYPSIKGAMFVGFMARTGMRSVVRLLRGELNPSGRTVDTWYYHTQDHPASKNSGDFKYQNAKNRYLLMYKEDIYVGYRYTETFLSEEEYRKKVQFPFGYGLSYTTFAWEEPQMTLDDESLTVSVAVTNSGKIAGADVVEIYVHPPYTGRMEKAKKVLAGFKKTRVLAAGETESVTLTIPLYTFASYSTADAAYVLEAGEYGVEFATDAHHAKETCAFTLPEEKRFCKDAGGTVKNRFAQYEGDFHRLSREDANADVITGPTPEELVAPTAIQNYTKRQKHLPLSINGCARQHKETCRSAAAAGAILTADFISREYLTDSFIPRGGGMPTVGADYGLKFSDVADKDYHDPAWGRFTEQFTIEEMIHLVTFGGFQTTGNERLGLPETVQSDGPGGIHDTETGRFGISHPSGTLLASTWNPVLGEEFGAQIGREAKFLNVNGWYAPSVNLHRSPYGGRCFEYYSEDPLLSGKMGAGVVRGANSQNLVTFVKHFALNEEDAHRTNVHTWCSEQAIREIYAKPFEIAVKEGNTHGIMSALNDIGVHWCGECEALLTGLLREEWDFKGAVVSDFASFTYQRSDTGVPAGNDLWLAPMNNNYYIKSLQKAYKKDPAGIARALQGAAKHICYMVARSNVTQKQHKLPPK